MGFGTAGVVAGNLTFLPLNCPNAEGSIGSIAATVQSIVYGGLTTGIFSLLQSAGATMVLPSIGTLLTGVAATGAGIAVANADGQPVPSNSSDLLHQVAESTAGDDDDGNPPPYRTTVPDEYLLTPQAILVIVKSWDVGTYNPPGTDCTGWLGKAHKACERYGIPAAQKALCAMHHMRADCKEAAHAAECYDMTWEEFTVWLRRYDRELHTLIAIGV